MDRKSYFDTWLALGLVVLSGLLGVFGFGHQNDFTQSQTDIVALQRLAGLALEGISPYSREAVRQVAADLPFAVDELFYPPSLLALIIPLRLLDETTLRVVAVVFQMMSAAFIMFWVSGKIPVHRLFILFCPVLFYALYHTVRTGQVTCFVTVATLIFWDCYRHSSRATSWITAALLCMATMKPSITLAIVFFLIFERQFSLLTRAALVHVACGFLAALMTGINPLVLVQDWLAALPNYRELPQNSPHDVFVYGLSSAVYWICGVAPHLDLLAAPATYLIWRYRETLSGAGLVSLLLTTSFLVGTPHAYDFFLLVPGLCYLLGTRAGAFGYLCLCGMILVPQGFVMMLGLREFSNALRVIAPLVMWCLLLLSKRYQQPGRTTYTPMRSHESC